MYIDIGIKTFLTFADIDPKKMMNQQQNRKRVVYIRVQNGTTLLGHVVFLGTLGGACVVLGKTRSSPAGTHGTALSGDSARGHGWLPSL